MLKHSTWYIESSESETPLQHCNEQYFHAVRSTGTCHMMLYGFCHPRDATLKAAPSRLFAAIYISTQIMSPKYSFSTYETGFSRTASWLERRVLRNFLGRQWLAQIDEMWNIKWYYTSGLKSPIPKNCTVSWKLYISVSQKKGDKICALVSLGFHELLARCPLCNMKELSMMMKFALQRIRLSVLPGGH